MKKFLVAAIVSTMLAISPAYATQDCATDGDTVTLHGTMVRSSSAEDGTMKPRKIMDIVLDVPLCMTDQAEKYTNVELSPVSKKWLGHKVVVTGIVGPSGFGMWINVKHIKDDTETK